MIQKSKWLFILLIILCIPGCWSAYDINDRILVTAMLVDQGDSPDEVELTLLTPIPHRLISSPESGGGGGGSDKPYTFITKKGDTLEDAIKKIESDLTRKLTWGHSRVIVIGNKYAKTGIAPLVEWFIRQYEIRIRHQIYVTPGAAKDLIGVMPIYEQTPAEILNHLSNRDYTLRTFIIDFLNGSPPNQDAVASILIIKKDPNQSNTYIGVKGAAVFHNYKLVDTLNLDETLAVSWVKGSLPSLRMTFSLGSPKSRISIQVRNLKSSIRPRLKGNRIEYHIKLKGDARILLSQKALDLSKQKNVEQIEQLAAEQIKRQLMHALKKSQKSQADILRLGSYLDWWFPQRWLELRDHWDDYYQNQIFIRIEPKIRLTDFGYERPSIHIKH